MAMTMVLATLLTSMLVLFAWRLNRAFALFAIQKPYTATIEAPSVSVCIPARNETHALTECLENVLKSEYEKMEIIVFDDSSTDDTSLVIRSFAHAGVRFVPGNKLPTGWLGKNHALEVLAREASGTYIVFLDVDTKISSVTINQLVGYMVTEQLDMVSVIPRRRDTWRANVLFGTLRYFWQLTLFRRRIPATSSALWLIQRETLLQTVGGFAPYKHTVQPEMHLAVKLGSAAYHCLLAGKQLDVRYEKRWLSQLETSRRLLYPMTGGVWWQGGLALGGLIILNIPLLALCSVVVFGWSEVQIMGLWFVLVYMALYSVYTAHVWGQRWWIGGLLWPVIIFQELIVFVSSLWGYARHTITWKGRLVTQPAATSDYIKIDE